MNRSASQIKSRKLALGGLSASLSLVLMLGSALLPASTYAAPILAGLALLPVAAEIGASTALVSYAAVSLLSVFMVPDIETAAMFVAFYGYYPLLRRILQRIPAKPVRMLCKFLLFNAATLAAYLALIRLFRMDALAKELQGGVGGMLIASANLLFIVYDRMIEVLTLWYRYRLRKRLFGSDQ